MVCLTAQMMESKTSLNCRGGMLSRAGKQWLLTACNSRKKLVRCSGYSSRFLLIISRVHSNTASKILGTSSVMWFYGRWNGLIISRSYVAIGSIALCILWLGLFNIMFGIKLIQKCKSRSTLIVYDFVALKEISMSQSYNVEFRVPKM